MRFDIFGSCVSRDILSLGDAHSKGIEVGTTIARSSFLSPFLAPCAIEEKELDIPSAFQKRVVFWDMAKKQFERLAANPGDYLIVDFVEDRFPLCETYGGIATASNDFRQAGLPVEHYHRWERLTDAISGRSVSNYLDDFIHNLVSIYGPTRIILNVVYPRKTYIDANGNRQRFSADQEHQFEGYESRAKHLHRAFAHRLPQAHIINLSRKFEAKADHIWGRYPVHFDEEFYAECRKQLQMLPSKPAQNHLSPLETLRRMFL